MSSQSTSNTGSNIIPAGSTINQPLFLKPSVDLTPPGFASQQIIFDGNVFYEKSVRTGGALFSCEYIAFGAGDLELGDIGGEVDGNDPGCSQIALGVNAVGHVVILCGVNPILDIENTQINWQQCLLFDGPGNLYDQAGVEIIHSETHEYFDQNNNRILKVQQPAVAHAAVTLASAITQLNLLIDALSDAGGGHGLIA